MAPPRRRPTFARAAPTNCDVVRLIGPGGAGKTTTGQALAQRLALTFVDLDEYFTARHGSISEYMSAHGYAAYAKQNVHDYLNALAARTEPLVLALSSGFMTYATGVHPDYARLHTEIAASPTTLVLLPSLDEASCVAETVRRQLGRPFSRSAEREREVIRRRFPLYRDLPSTKVETMRTLSEVVDVSVARLTAVVPHRLSLPRCPRNVS